MTPPDKVKAILSTEKVHKKDGFEIPYVLKKGTSLSDSLVILFSGFAPLNSNIKYPFNYVRSLQDFEANILYISDNYGPRGCYYLGKEMKFDYEPIVFDLIETVRSELGVGKENVICAGSSKGGSAALYYAMKYGYGSVLAGAPQTRIATYMLEDTTTFRFMFGEQNAEIVEAGDRIIFDQMENCTTELTIVASPRDYQYSDHIQPLLEKMTSYGHSYRLIVDSRAANHNDIGVFFKNHLPRLLLDIILDRAKRKMEIPIHTMLRPMDEAKKASYSRTTRLLNLLPEEKIYLILFDGLFDKPASSASYKKIAELINGYKKLSLSIDYTSEEPISISYFIIQFLPDGKLVKHNKNIDLIPAANHNSIETDLIIPIDPMARSFEVALRFYAKNNSTVTILNPRLVLM